MLLYDIEKNGIFGDVISYMFSIEFQKRGLPHAHLIVTLHPNLKLFFHTPYVKWSFAHARVKTACAKSSFAHVI